MDPNTIDIIVVTDSNGKLEEVFTTETTHPLHVHIVDCFDTEVGEPAHIYGYPVPVRVGETADVIHSLTLKYRKKED